MERHPLEEIAEARLEALLDKDWARYKELGDTMLRMIDERHGLTGQDLNSWDATSYHD